MQSQVRQCFRNQSLFLWYTLSASYLSLGYIEWWGKVSGFHDHGSTNFVRHPDMYLTDDAEHIVIEIWFEFLPMPMPMQWMIHPRPAVGLLVLSCPRTKHDKTRHDMIGPTSVAELSRLPRENVKCQMLREAPERERGLDAWHDMTWHPPPVTMVFPPSLASFVLIFNMTSGWWW